MLREELAKVTITGISRRMAFLQALTNVFNALFGTIRGSLFFPVHHKIGEADE